MTMTVLMEGKQHDLSFIHNKLLNCYFNYSDEGKHCNSQYKTCSPQEFTCQNFKCIRLQYRCDGEDGEYFLCDTQACFEQKRMFIVCSLTYQHDQGQFYTVWNRSFLSCV